MFIFSAGLASLILITLLVGLIKVWFNKRDLKEKIKLANLEAAIQRTDKEKLVGDRKLDEGDLFGVRAIQAGFFGGVSQSRPNSPSVRQSPSIGSIGSNTKDEVTPKSSPLALRPPSAARKKPPSSENSGTGTPPSPLQSRNLSPSEINPLA
ncbi:hypothetical protein K3495_g7318 [Podosphaera aphanis]|nr:hypothetical protein K3495_g7318 [Podosphaera aphanis]